jgi:hypothetical protein
MNGPKDKKAVDRGVPNGRAVGLRHQLEFPNSNGR